MKATIVLLAALLALPALGADMKLKLSTKTRQGFEWNAPNLSRRDGQGSNWLFQANMLKQTRGTDPDKMYKWDGKTLRPLRNANQNNTFIYENDTIMPQSRLHNKSFVKDGDNWKPKQNAGPTNTWELDGEIPIPVVIAVLYGLADDD